ncbi:MAG TPA: hypothetical protein VF254_10225 [Gammaproteobacteria bacterium]
MTKFRIFCALFASVAIMAAPAYLPDADSEREGTSAENTLAST